MTHDLKPTPPSPRDALIAGLAGATAMTLAHESLRRVWADAPRLDTLGRRSLAGLIRTTGHPPPARDRLQGVALAGDLASNTALFGLAVAAGPAHSAPVRGLAAGVVAGLLTLALPPVLRIGPPPRRLPRATQAATVALYAGGGLVSGLAARRRANLDRRSGSTPS